MATDMAQHNTIMEQFSSVADSFSFDDEQQMKLVSNTAMWLSLTSTNINCDKFSTLDHSLS